VAGMGETGFLLSPYIRDASGFVSLSSHYRDELPGQTKVASLVLRGERGARWMWRSQFKLKLAKLDVPATVSADTALVGSWSEGMPESAYPAGGNCNIESVNDVDIGTAPLDLPPKLVKVRGWAALDAQSGIPNQGVSLLAAFPDGRNFVVPVSAVSRLDVAQYFKHPGLDPVGYEAFVDVRKLSGLVHFRVLQKDGDVMRVCHPPLLSIRRIEPGEPIAP
jgi:hypothetical protein